MISALPRQPSLQLKGFKLFDVSLAADDWRPVIRAIDFTALEWIDFRYTDLCQEHLDRFSGSLDWVVTHHEVSDLPLKALLVNKDVLNQDDPDGWYARFSKTIPRTTIHGT